VATPGVGDKAPNFSLPDTAGVNHSLAEFRGKVVLLNFWQSG
jgi:peroxiredoxin